MIYGEVKNLKEAPSLFIKTVKNSFGIDIKSVSEGLRLVNEAVRAFESRMERNDEIRVNLLFYNGEAYLNGFRPTSSFNNFYLRGKTYQPKQLCDILGYSKYELEAFKDIRDSIDIVLESIEGKFYSIEEFWYEIRDKSNHEIDKILERAIEDSPDFLEKYFIETARFISGARTIKFNTTKSPFKKYILDKVFDMAIEKSQDFLSRVVEYISVFSRQDAREFESRYLNNNFIDIAPNIYKDLKIYSHTEYLVQYLIRTSKSNKYDETVYMITYNDMCNQCESLFLKQNFPNNQKKLKTVVVSCFPYQDSREKYVDNCIFDKNLILIRLEEEDLLNSYNYNNNNYNNNYYRNNKRIRLEESESESEESESEESESEESESEESESEESESEEFEEETYKNFHGKNEYRSNNREEYRFSHNYRDEHDEEEDEHHNYRDENDEEDDEHCPYCGAELILRHGRYGDFLGCSNFPRCRFTVDYQ